jgi:O-antigen/teichoic acid export membrane protein
MTLIDKLKTLAGDSLINKSLKVLVLRIIGVLLFFSLTLFLTNFFKPELVGQYDFVRSLLIFLGGISIFGMHQSIIYYSGFLSAQNALYAIKPVYNKMVVIMLVTCALILLFFYLIDNNYINLFFEKKVAFMVMKTVGALFFYGITMLNIDVLRGINKIFISELYRNVFRYLPFIIGVIFIYSFGEQELLVDLFLLSFVFLGVISTIYVITYFPKDKLANSKISISYRDIIKRSGPMAISSIAYMLMQSVDIILLSKFTDFDSVAFYAVAIKLTMIISL